jgi:iron complex transport system substrate-binding protein
VIDAQPDVVILMPCGMPIERTRADLDAITSRDGWTDLPAVRDERVYIVDASSYFNRPGPRVVRGAEILAALLHPDLFAPPTADEAVSV